MSRGAAGVLLDVDGVLVTSWEPLPGAVETIAWLRGANVPFLLVTNTTTRSRASLARDLAPFEVGPDDLLTAPMATAAYLRTEHPGARVHLLAAGEVAEDLEGIELVDSRAEVVVIGGASEPDPEHPDATFTYENLNRAFGMLLDGARLVAMHRNLSWRTSRGIVLDSGAFVVGLERAAKVEAEVVGKPSAAFFRAALERLGMPADRALMVGDDIEADVEGARSAGIRGVLVRTGKFRPEHLEVARPDHVIDSIADLPGLLGG
ncbi:MAG TPA: TIGR01458 family HAD-type hydrolase [Actinomycetota bacterium]